MTTAGKLEMIQNLMKLGLINAAEAIDLLSENLDHYTVQNWKDIKIISEECRKKYPNAETAWQQLNTKLAKALK